MVEYFDRKLKESSWNKLENHRNMWGNWAKKFTNNFLFIQLFNYFKNRCKIISRNHFNHIKNVNAFYLVVFD